MHHQKYYWIKRFRTNKFYFYFSILQLFLTCILLFLAYMTYNEIQHKVQFIIAALLTFDLVVRYFSDQCFFRKIINDIDMGLVIMLWGFMIIQFFLKDISNFVGQIQSIVIALRYGIQVARVWILFRQSKQTKQCKSFDDICLDLDLGISDQLGQFSNQMQQNKLNFSEKLSRRI